MSRKRVSEENKLFTVCGTVRRETLLKIQHEAQGPVTIARVVGGILEDWATDPKRLEEKGV